MRRGRGADLASLERLATSGLVTAEDPLLCAAPSAAASQAAARDIRCGVLRGGPGGVLEAGRGTPGASFGAVDAEGLHRHPNGDDCSGKFSVTLRACVHKAYLFRP